MHRKIEEKLLPHRDKDPIMRLYSHYFMHSDFILSCAKEVEKKAKKSKTGKVRSETLFKYVALRIHWLATLYVVIDAFEEMEFGKELLKRPEEFSKHPTKTTGFHEILLTFNNTRNIYLEHKDHLKKFRNGVFHFQDDARKLTQLFDSNRNIIQWAENLHKSIGVIFSEYRSARAVYCAMEGRDEGDWGPPRYMDW